MRKAVVIAFVILLSVPVAWAQRKIPASKAELAEITERGRQLAAYDVAVWHASDAVALVKPAEGSVARYLARRQGDVWQVSFGRLNENRDKFLIAYEATQGARPVEFVVKKYDPPKEDADFYLSAAKAVETAMAEFTGEARPYNVAVLPATGDQLYVYFVPAQTKEGVYPLGSDARYLVSRDGTRIIEKRQLHKSIIEFATPPNIKVVQGGFHTAVLDDVPEDTDVFHVLSRRPSVPEWVASRKYVYRVEPDGTITYVMTTEAFKKMKP
jgi:hypothetical protein